MNNRDECYFKSEILKSSFRWLQANIINQAGPTSLSTRVHDQMMAFPDSIHHVRVLSAGPRTGWETPRRGPAKWKSYNSCTWRWSALSERPGSPLRMSSGSFYKSVTPWSSSFDVSFLIFTILGITGLTYQFGTWNPTAYSFSTSCVGVMSFCDSTSSSHYGTFLDRPIKWERWPF